MNVYWCTGVATPTLTTAQGGVAIASLELALVCSRWCKYEALASPLALEVGKKPNKIVYGKSGAGHFFR